MNELDNADDDDDIDYGVEDDIVGGGGQIMGAELMNNEYGDEDDE